MRSGEVTNRVIQATEPLNPQWLQIIASQPLPPYHETKQQVEHPPEQDGDKERGKPG
jgi:hypothetical protein